MPASNFRGKAASKDQREAGQQARQVSGRLGVRAGVWVVVSVYALGSLCSARPKHSLGFVFFFFLFWGLAFKRGAVFSQD